MLFKNLVFHRMPAEWTLTAADLEGQLASRPLQPCGPFEMSSRGWVPVTSGGRLLHTLNHHHMIALGDNQKLLPGSIIRQVAQERAEIQAEDQGFPVGRKQMRDLRARVADELRAFLAERFAKWQLPDAFVFATEIPRTSVGKFLKLKLREQYADWKWD